jgi:FecR protein
MILSMGHPARTFARNAERCVTVNADGRRDMTKLAILTVLFSGLVLGGDSRYARLGEFEGKVEVRLQPGDGWSAGLRNLVLMEPALMRTGPASRAEIELDEATAIRLGPDSLCELSDYTRLSTGQRLTVVSLEQGTAYMTGEAAPNDSLVLAGPGAQAAIGRGARVRMAVSPNTTEIAVIEGSVRFASTTAELDLPEGRTARLDPNGPEKFSLLGEIAHLDSDAWSEQRDRALSSAVSIGHVKDLKYGIADLDAAGTWIDTADYGTVWKPRVPEGWMPFRNGKWTWIDRLGFTWISSDSWGWAPYHYGRWMRTESIGWFWVPLQSTVFKPGDVYWLKGPGLAGWGPLAPAERWNGTGLPQLYLASNTTFAKFSPGAREIDPETARVHPKDPLAAAAFAKGLPGASLDPARLDAERSVLRARMVRSWRPPPSESARGVLRLLKSIPAPQAAKARSAHVPRPNPPPSRLSRCQ